MNAQAIILAVLVGLFAVLGALLLRSISREVRGIKPRRPRALVAAPELRYAATRYDRARGLQGELQQLWVAPGGRVEWRAVPRVPV